MRTAITEGIVLKRSDVGEADRIFTVYTKDLGKISARAPGIRFSKSRKAPHMEPGNVVKFELATGRNLYVLTGAKVMHHLYYPNLSSMQALFLWLEIVNLVTQPGEVNTDLYHLVIEGMAAAEQFHDKPYLLVLKELNLYSTIGYKVQVKYCIIGHEHLVENGNLISFRAGGILCLKHKNAAPDAVPLSSEAIKILRLLQKNDWVTMTRLRITNELGQELQELAELQRHEMFEKPLQSELLMKKTLKDV